MGRGCLGMAGVKGSPHITAIRAGQPAGRSTHRVMVDECPLRPAWLRVVVGGGWAACAKVMGGAEV